MGAKGQPMQPEDIARAVGLMALAAAIGASLLISQRRALGRMAQWAATWGLIFVGVALAYGLWSDIRLTRPQQAVLIQNSMITLPRQRDGHFYLTLGLNDTPVTFMIDTGASDVVLSRKDARRIGLDPDALAYYGSAATANGRVSTARVDLATVTLEGAPEQPLTAWVNDGAMPHSLLGMRFLERFSKIELMGDRMILQR